MAEQISQNGKTAAPKERKKLVEVNHLIKYFPVRAGLMQRVKAWVKAVDDVSFFINEGETFGLVGESGCGKTTVGRTILRLIPATSGEVLLNGNNIFDLNASELKKQCAPTCRSSFRTPIRRWTRVCRSARVSPRAARPRHDKGGQERYDIVTEMLTRVGMRAEHARRYPHEFSGGQRQRIGIARALALRPEVHRLRRAGVGARRVDPGPGAQHPARASARLRPDLPVHRPRPERGRALQRPRGGDVPGQDGGDGPARPLYADRCTPTRRRCCRPSRCPIPPTSDNASSSKATCPARSTRPAAAASTRAAPLPLIFAHRKNRRSRITAAATLPPATGWRRASAGRAS